MKVKELIEKLNPYMDFEVDVRIERRLTEDELKDSSYPYPFEYIPSTIEIGDIGHSDKIIKIDIIPNG